MLLVAMVLMMADRPDTEAMIEASWERTLVVGHRGAAAYEPENTLPGFEEAIKSGADATECDVHVSSNGHLMVLHDETLDRTTTLTGAVGQTPSWTMIEAGVPTLGQLCDLTCGRIVLVVEIKGGEDVEQKVVDELVGRDMVRQSVVFSFSERTIAEVERRRPDLFTVWLVGSEETAKDEPALLRRRAELGADGIGMSYYGVSEPVVERLRAERIPLFVWTVPPGPAIDRLQQLRVNFIITDHPRHVREQLGSSD